MSLPIEVSTPDMEGKLEVSKSRKLPVLMEKDELEALFEAMGSFEIFDGSRPVQKGEMLIERPAFLSAYGSYAQGIQAGKLMDEALVRPLFSAFFSCCRDTVYAQQLSNGKYLLKPRRPVIQLKRYHFIYANGEFYLGVMGEESITWGIEFSYPTLFLDPKTQRIGKVGNHLEFPNTELFTKLARWVRHHTYPTPFWAEGRKTNQPIRISERCLEWINHHPALLKKGLYVGRENHPSTAH